MTEIKGTIEELKEVVQDLYRSAANLDNTIQAIEMEKSNHDEKYYDFFVNAEATYRKDYKQVRGYSNLEERENLIWKKFIENLKTEEES